MGSFDRLWQFWSHQIVIGILSGAVTAAIVLVSPGTIESIPQTGFEALTGGLATLLGLTFTSFSILTTFMPGLRRDFVKSQTFSSMGATFVLTMAAQISALSGSAVCFVFYRTEILNILSPPTVFLSLLSVGLMAELVSYMFSLFEMARRGLSD